MTSKKTRKNSKSARKPTLLRRLFGLCFKLGLILLAVVAVYGIYLDQQIRERIDGNVWELPAAVYGQIVNLEPDDRYSKDDIMAILNGAQYRQVVKSTRAGEFVVNNDNIEIYRRPFIFPDGEEPAYRVRIVFSNNAIDRITNMETERDFGLFRIDPKLITMLQSPHGEQRLFVPLKNFPDSLIKTLIATEDKRFYQHDGVSLYSIGRAIITNLISGRTVQGGSTLTQQLVKNLFLTSEKSYSRKLREAYMALILDFRYSKERILELYLNEVYLGQSGDEEIHGFPLASLYYFGRPVEELTLDQQALLVGIVKGASYYNPWRQPERAKERRDVVLKLLEEQDIIDEELYQLLSERPLTTLPKGGVISPQPAFMQLVRNELQARLGEKANYLSGVKIFTTFDPVAQNAAETAVTDDIEKLRQRSTKDNLEAAMVVVNRGTGEIKAIIGSSEPRYAGFNRALLARRPIGSLAKPPTYLTALSQPERYQLNSWLYDMPLSITLENGQVWQPQNFDRQFRGRVLLEYALAHSLNIPSVNLGMAVGLEPTAKTLLDLGIPKEAIKQVPARFLGALELTPVEVAQMYQAIANNGQKAALSTLRFVLSESGELIYQSYPQTQQAVSPQAAYLTLYAMQKVVEYGTARSLNSQYSQYKLAAKTGSSNDLKDSWFVGIDGSDVTAIWVGLDDHKPMQLTGSAGALNIYKSYLARHTPQLLRPIVPPNIYQVGVNSEGQWQCYGQTARSMPAWTGDPKSLCAGNNQVPASEESETKEQAPEWLTEMFKR